MNFDDEYDIKNINVYAKELERLEDSYVPKNFLERDKE